MGDSDDRTPVPPAVVDAAVRNDRRAFLRRAAGEVVTGASRLFELSSLAQRSAAAAVATADGLRPAAEDAPPAGEQVRAPVAAPTEAPPAQKAPPPALSADQHSFISAAASAVVAVNDLGGTPHLTASWFHWDGTVFRLPTGAFSAKAANLAHDPGVSLLIGDVDRGWVAVTGRAELVLGPAAQAEARGLLQKYRPGVAPDVAWADLDQAADTAIVVVTPSRFLWRLGG
jgi:Pyridoxamine 5'-phosphate oxidase